MENVNGRCELNDRLFYLFKSRCNQRVDTAGFLCYCGNASLQNCLYLDTLLVLERALPVNHSISNGFRSGLRLGCSKTFILFLSSHSGATCSWVSLLSHCIIHSCFRLQIERRTGFSQNFYNKKGGTTDFWSWCCEASLHSHVATMLDCWYEANGLGTEPVFQKIPLLSRWFEFKQCW